MKMTAAIGTFLLFVMLQALNGNAATDATKIQCTNGEYVEYEHLCNTTNSTELFPNCRGSDCANNVSDQLDNRGLAIPVYGYIAT